MHRDIQITTIFFKYNWAKGMCIKVPLLTSNIFDSYKFKSYKTYHIYNTYQRYMYLLSLFNPN